ncbi:MAG TPA: TonB family protein, partial [Candidatus Sumerlaeota bacterium]|nr:TonB family protein [Candidatus Sumerlaeota bacterium]
AEYLDQVVAALQKNFVLPPYIRENKTCTVRYRILRNGRLDKPRVVNGQGTGIPGLDQLALNAVLQAGPVPPYPPEYSTRPFVYARVNFAFTPSAP